MQVSLHPYHGKIGSTTFKLALPAVPKHWHCEQLHSTAATFWADCAGWAAALEAVVQRAEAMMKKLELHDERRSV